MTEDRSLLTGPEPYSVSNAGLCMECGERAARIAVPGPGGSTWLLCLPCTAAKLNRDMERLIALLQREEYTETCPPEHRAGIGARNGVWHAYCSCGWVAEGCGSRGQAEDDHAAHVRLKMKPARDDA